MLLRIKNAPNDTYFWDGTQGSFSWNWKAGNTSGLAIGPMQHILSGNRFSFTFQVNFLEK